MPDNSCRYPAMAVSASFAIGTRAASPQLTAADDLTLIPFLSRSDRDAMRDTIPTIAAFAAINPDGFINGKKTVFAGMGADRLRQLQARAVMLKGSPPKPYLREPVTLDVFPIELFFDIEVDPLRGICYLHGFVERHNADNATERFVPFSSRGADVGSRARRLRRCPGLSCHACRRRDLLLFEVRAHDLPQAQQKYPDICTPEDVERLFEPPRAVDLYGDVVRKATEWPTRDHSIKTLAKYLGFTWRDTHPSGAASVEWFDRWCRERKPEIRQRILDYNEDDCRATRVLLDGIRSLAV